MKARVVAVAFVAVILAGACGSESSRPGDADWALVWVAERDSVPDAEVFVVEGEDLCEPLLGEIRSTRQELLPTPTEGLDDAVDAWINHAESIAFDCPTDEPAQLRDRLHDLDVLAAEVDAGLNADRTP